MANSVESYVQGQLSYALSVFWAIVTLPEYQSLNCMVQLHRLIATIGAGNGAL